MLIRFVYLQQHQLPRVTTQCTPYGAVFNHVNYILCSNINFQTRNYKNISFLLSIISLFFTAGRTPGGAYLRNPEAPNRKTGALSPPSCHRVQVPPCA